MKLITNIRLFHIIKKQRPKPLTIYRNRTMPSCCILYVETYHLEITFRVLNRPSPLDQFNYLHEKLRLPRPWKHISTLISFFFFRTPEEKQKDDVNSLTSFSHRGKSVRYTRSHYTIDKHGDSSKVSQILSQNYRINHLMNITYIWIYIIFFYI